MRNVIVRALRCILNVITADCGAISGALAGGTIHGKSIAVERADMTRTLVISITTLIITLSIGSASASAQSTDDTAGRAKALSAARDQKSEHITPPERSMTERVLHWYDNRDSRLSWRGFHVNMGNFSGGAGFAAGIGLTQRAIGSPVVDPYQHNRVDLDLSAGRSILGYQRLSARVDVLNIAGAPINFGISWRDDQMPQEDFYGLGPGSDESHRVSYGLDTTDTTIGLEWKPFRNVTIGGAMALLQPVVGPGTDRRHPSIEVTFDPESTPGINGLPDFLRTDAMIGFDWRDSPSHPRRGGHYYAVASQYDGRSSTANDFRRVDVQLQQIVPLGNRYRRLELRAQAALSDADANARVPIIYQPSLGGMSTLRGFPRGRFRDRQAVTVSAEYQWEAWWALDAAVFVDSGQVMNRLRDLEIGSFETSYGIGLRLHSNSAFLARLDLAYGREGFVPLLGFKYGF